MTQTQFKKLRRKLGLTQQQLADKMRVNVSTVWRWENGKSNVPHLVAVIMEEMK